MRVFITTVGTRGDVQPYVALGRGLQAAGHTVTVNTAARFESFVTGHGLRYGHLTDDLLALMHSPAGQAAIAGGTGPADRLKGYVELARRSGPIQLAMIRDSWAAAEAARPDLIVYHPKAYWGPYFADRLRIPLVFAPLVPMFVPTATVPNIGFPALPLGGWYNRLTYRLVLGTTAMGTDRYMKSWRKAQGVPPRGRGRTILETRQGAAIPILHGYSPHVVPPPADWPPHVAATGYWPLEEDDWVPPPALEAFLAAGPPPVFVGFGSMGGRGADRLVRLALDAIQRAGVRGVIAARPEATLGLALPTSILALDGAPHARLFPHMAAVVHHGGAGTTAAGLRAGLPTLVCPFMGDQPFWGRRVHALGAGPAPIPQKSLTVDALTAALRQLTSDVDTRQSADALGRALRAEDGVGRAVESIEAIARHAG